MLSLAAPNAASSSVARYSRAARQASGPMSAVFHSLLGSERCLLASAAMRLASTAKPSPPTRPSRRQRSTTASNRRRRMSLSLKRPGRVIRHLAVQTEPTEPAIREIEMDFLTEPPFGTDAHAVADDQHPQHQVGIDRGPADSAVERPQLCTDALQINKPVDAAKQMIPWHIIIEAEIIEQLRRRDLHAHHRLSLLLQNN